MDHAALLTTEKKHEYPILIVDRKGLIGEKIANELKEESLIVFVSRVSPISSENIVHIPFVKRFPTIPSNTYSHIFLIDEDLGIVGEIIDQFVKKAKIDNASLILAAGMDFVKEDFIKNFVSSYDKARMVIFGDVFAKDFIYDPQTEINKYIQEVKGYKKISVPGDGTRQVPPVFIEDLSSGILQTAFGTNNEGKVFYIFPKHKITLLSLAHIFQKNDPDIRIDFIKEEKIKQDNFVPQLGGVYLLGDSYNLSERIKKIEYEKIIIEEVRKEPVYKEEKKRGIGFKAVFLAFIFFLFLPLISTLLFAFVGLNSLMVLKSDAEKGNLLSSKNTAIFASKNFDFALGSSTILLQEANLIRQAPVAQGIIDKVIFGKDISSAAVSLTDAAGKFKNIASGVSRNPAMEFSAALVELKDALFIYNKEQQDGLIPQTIVNRFGDLANMASSTIDLWSDIMGFNGTRNYLVLFQNNMELRPGGGFIGSYGILTVSKGRLISFKIYDVYDADGQLKTHIEPPFPIRRYLPSLHWYLRDSNFNVDFSKGAIASAVFYNTEMHQAVDGVIGIDLSFVKNLLSATGPVKVTDYNQTVDANNLFPITQSHAEKDFFPGSTQKKDFLRSLFNSLELKITESKNISYLNLLQSSVSSVYEKHILFAFSNTDEQATFAVNGWSSALIDKRPQDDSRINDFVGINEANLGADKVNYYVTRSLAQSVSIASDGSVAENLTVALKNSAQKTSWTGGVYETYLRIILPLGANVSKIQIDDKDQNIVPAITDPAVYEKKDFTPPSGLEVDKQDQDKNTIYGFLVTLQPQDVRTIVITYSLPQKLNVSKADLAYDLKIFKQPGIDSYPYSLSINIPQGLKVADSPADAKTSGQNTSISTQITRDREVILNLGQ